MNLLEECIEDSEQEDFQYWEDLFYFSEKEKQESIEVNNNQYFGGYMFVWFVFNIFYSIVSCITLKKNVSLVSK